MVMHVPRQTTVRRVTVLEVISKPVMTRMHAPMIRAIRAQELAHLLMTMEISVVIIMHAHKLTPVVMACVLAAIQNRARVTIIYALMMCAIRRQAIV